MIKKFISKLGRDFLGFFYYLGDVSVLFGKTVFASVTPPWNKKRIFHQMSRIGVNSLPLIFLTSIFTGMVLAFQSAYQMEKISAKIYVASLVSLSLTRELAPVLTALVVAGRVGASITAELGTMKVTEQVDALESLATNPIDYLVVPRYYALLLMLPLLTIYADIIGILGGFIVGVFKLNIGATFYTNMTIETLKIKDVVTGLIKAFAFGMIICIVSCYEGLSAKGGAEGVGKVTTSSVVTSFILIIAVDCFFTVLFYYVF